VARIFNFPKPGASTEMKDPSEVPVANPLGSWPTEPMYSRYSSTPENSGSVSGVSIDDATLLAVVTPKDLVADGDDETVNADERAAAITESVNRNIEVYHTIVDSLFFFVFPRFSPELGSEYLSPLCICETKRFVVGYFIVSDVATHLVFF
jgi:hypothetical protein